MRASAPGKVLLAGEYAVLEGADAVVAAVSRRALAHIEERETERSPFLESARAALARDLGAGSRAARAAARVAVDTRALCAPAGTKLGLGSSAAATAAAVACALGAESAGLDRERVHRLAHAAHGDAQVRRGARGSGADVAASVHGGVLAVRPRTDGPPDVRPLAVPPDLHLAFVWTGAAADTPGLIGRVGALAGRDPEGYRRLTDALAGAAVRLRDALAAGDAVAAVSALGAGGGAIAALGEAAGVELATAIHRDLARLAQARGGAAKPTGAGAGDVALAAFASAAAARDFRGDLRRAGIAALDLGVDEIGVALG